MVAMYTDREKRTAMMPCNIIRANKCPKEFKRFYQI